MANRKHIFRRGPASPGSLIALVLVALVFIFINAFTNWLAPLRSVTLDLVAPLYRVTDLPRRISQWTQDNLSDRDLLLGELRRLEEENLILQGRAATMADVLAENARLRRLLNAAELVQARVLIAELVGVPPDVETHRIIINRGTTNEVRPGQPVIDNQGLVGQVVSVGNAFSEVLMISDRASAVPVQLARNGTRAIAEGTGEFNRLRLRYVAPTADIRIGDELITSGLGGRFPKGYAVGVVRDISLPESSPYLEVNVESKADLQSLRYMLLLFADRALLDSAEEHQPQPESEPQP